MTIRDLFFSPLAVSVFSLALGSTACTTDRLPDEDGGTVDVDDVDSGTGEEWDSAAYAAAIMAGAWAEDMTLTFDTDTLTISDDGIPDVGALEAYALNGGATTPVIATPYSHEIPMHPVLAAEATATSLGAIGVTLSGGLMFNPYDGGGEVALDVNFVADGIPFIDSCNGHPVASGNQYHYHGIPYCITDVIDSDGEHSALLGVLLDGFPLYGPRAADGEPPTDLDACNGHTESTLEFPEGIYHYHLSEVSPYTVTCYAGEVTAATNPGGGPGGGPGGDPGAENPTDVMDCTEPPTGGGCCGDNVCDGPETGDNCPVDCE